MKIDEDALGGDVEDRPGDVEGVKESSAGDSKTASWNMSRWSLSDGKDVDAWILAEGIDEWLDRSCTDFLSDPVPDDEVGCFVSLVSGWASSKTSGWVRRVTGRGKVPFDSITAAATACSFGAVPSQHSAASCFCGRQPHACFHACLVASL